MSKGSGSNDLLKDLLNEAKKGVAQEEQKISAEANRREQIERDLRDREEARKREEAQRTLIEENRRRNEALAKRDREGERKSAATAKHALVQPVAAAPVAAAAAPPAKVGTGPKLILAGLVAGGLALGVGTGLALQPEMKGSFPDIALAARGIVTQASKTAAAEKKLNDELGKLRADLSGLQGQLGGAGTDVQRLRTELGALKGDLERTKKELEEARLAAGGKKPTPATPPGITMPKLDDCTFGNCKKKTP